MVCWLPGVHWNVCGAVTVTPSTMTCNPDGTVVTVIPWGAAVKLAVTFRAALIVTETGFAVPLALPLQEENCWPEAGNAVNCTPVPLL